MYLKEEILLPFKILSRPIDGFSQLKFEKLGKLGIAFIILGLLCFLYIIEYKYTGFIVNFNSPEKFNSIKLIIVITFPFFLFVTGNWSITSLMNGKGTFKEIVIFTTYSFVPTLLCNIIALIYSQIIIQQEAVLYYAILAAGFGWSILLLFLGILVVHEYSVKKGFITVILTLIVMGILIFILLLMFSLIQQIYGFLFSISKEITLRFL